MAGSNKRSSPEISRKSISALRLERLKTTSGTTSIASRGNKFR